VVNDDPHDRHASEASGDSAQCDPPRLRVVGEDVYPDWDAIYLDNVTRIYRLMYAKVGNRPDAEDLTAEVFVAALGPLRVSASRGEVRGYLVATARTVLAGYWRRRLGVEVTTIDPDAELRGLDEPDRASRRPQVAPRAMPLRHGQRRLPWVQQF
jgi:DNA-directed RNA polymerase specialized sigma24 family protein